MILPLCIECAKIAKKVEGSQVYPHRADLHSQTYWLCECGAYCGSHAESEEPLGYPAGPITRQARRSAHAAFDPLWKTGRIKRKQAYMWLSAVMGLHKDACHIGMMTTEQASRVVLVCGLITGFSDD